MAKEQSITQYPDGVIQTADVFVQEELTLPTDPTLNIAPSAQGSMVDVGNFSSPVFNSGSIGWNLDSNGNAEFNNGTFRGKFVIGGTVITIDNTASIQAYLDLIHSNGGGTLYLKPGTYKVPATLNFYSSIALIGTSASSTILDMQSTGRNLSLAGGSAYTTGTITSITSSVFVTGSGTLWLANVTAGQHLFLGTRWYKIAAVTSNTTLILAEGYGDTVTLPASYRISSVLVDVVLSKFKVISSSGTGITLSDTRKINVLSVESSSNNVGLSFTNCSEVVVDEFFAITNTSDGVQITNMGLFNFSSVNTIANGGNGVTANNWKTGTLHGCASDGNTGDGYNLSNANSISFLIDASSNGGQGVEMVSGCSDIDIHGSDLAGNASDGLKLTASDTNCNFYGNFIVGNGGYGINVAASSCVNNYIVAPTFASNASGDINDNGTSTNIISKVSPAKFGGSGADGPLTVSSGTTTIDLGNASSFIKNYTAISITGTGAIAFSNPNVNGTTIKLMSQGDITLTSSATPMIDCSGLGGDKGAGQSIGVSSSATGSGGTPAYGFGAFTNNFGAGGVGGGSGGAGQGGALPSFSPATAIMTQGSGKYPFSVAGAGGGGGGVATAGGASATSGAGGRGGGNLIMECAGAWNFTTTGGISVAGKNGVNGTGSGGNYAAGGGGGGGGGNFTAFYNSLTANTGTITISGGSGGSGGGTGATTTATGGGGGGSVLGAGGNGVTATGAGATGGSGGTGSSLIAKNTEFA